MQATVVIKLDGLKRFARQVAAQEGPIKGAFKKWAARYRAFVQRRFVLFSQGGGSWAPLSPRTLAGRIKGKGTAKFGKGSVAILRNTGLLFNALNPVFVSDPGAIEEGIPFGVRVGYGGDAKYPDGRATVADVANFHQMGGPTLPKREIIVPPDEETISAMAKDMQLALYELAGGKP